MNFITHIDADGKPTVIPVNFEKVFNSPNPLSVEEIRLFVRNIEDNVWNRAALRVRELEDQLRSICTKIDDSAANVPTGAEPEDAVRKVEELIDRFEEHEETLSGIEACLDGCEGAGCSGDRIPDRVTSLIDGAKEDEDRIEELQDAVETALDALKAVRRD